MREPFAVGGDPVAVGHAHARGGAVPGEDDVAVAVDLRSDRAARRSRPRSTRTSLSLQLLLHVGDPALAEALPGQACRRRAGPAATTAPSPPRRYPRPARCRAASRRACPARARLRSITSASLALPALERCERPSTGLFQRLQRPARPLGAGAGGKAGIARAGGGFHCWKQSFTVASSTKSAASY